MDPTEELVRYYAWLRRYGYNDSHSGNASRREGDRFWITPTGASADRLEARDLVHCGMDGTLGEGASLDAPLHLAVYRAVPQARALLHSHGPYTVAMTFDGRDFRPVDFEGQYYFSRIQVIDLEYAHYLEQAPRRVAEALGRSPVTVVRGHGVYAWGETLDRAYKWTCSLELSAKTAFLARQAGTLD